MCREGMAAVACMGSEPVATAGMARLLHETARACIFNDLPEEAALLGRQALDLAERLGAVELQAEALTSLGLLPDQPPQEAAALHARALELAEAAGLLPQAARAENNLGAAYLGLGDLGSARAHYLRSAELERQTGSVAGELLSRVSAANVTLVQGALVTAEQELLALRQLAVALPDPGMAAVWLSDLENALLYLRGQLTEAAARWQSRCAELTAAGHLSDLTLVAAHLADIQWEMGNKREAEVAARVAMDAMQQLSAPSIEAICILTFVYAQRGELELARTLLSRAHEVAAAAGQIAPFDAASISYAEAHLAAAEGRWPEAHAAFEGAAAECRRLGMRWVTAVVLLEWAEALLARGEPGDREQVLSLLAQAAAEFDAIGAPYYAERANRRMADLAQR